MKKNAFLFLCIVMCAALMFAGCSADETTPHATQSADFKATPAPSPAASESASATQSKAATQPDGTYAETASSDSTNPSDTSYSETSAAMAAYNVNDYEERIIDLMGRMDNAQTSDYKPLKKEARQISDEMDRTEDLAEIDYYNGKISNTEYIQIERELEVLEEMLDHAEDSMEFKLGIDD